MCVVCELHWRTLSLVAVLSVIYAFGYILACVGGAIKRSYVQSSYVCERRRRAPHMSVWLLHKNL